MSVAEHEAALNSLSSVHQTRLFPKWILNSFSQESLSLLSTLPQIYSFTSPLINISQCPFVRVLTPELFSFSQNVRRRRDGGNRSSASSPDYYHFCVNIPVRIGRIWCVNGSKKVKTCSNSAGWKLKSQRTEWSRRRRRDGAATELTSRQKEFIPHTDADSAGGLTLTNQPVTAGRDVLEPSVS